MDESQFTQIMTILGYEKHIIDQFNASINRTDDEKVRVRARKNAVLAGMDRRPYLGIGIMIDGICDPVSR